MGVLHDRATASARRSVEMALSSKGDGAKGGGTVIPNSAKGPPSSPEVVEAADGEEEEGVQDSEGMPVEGEDVQQSASPGVDGAATATTTGEVKGTSEELFEEIIEELRQTPAKFPLKRARLVRRLKEEHDLSIKQIARMWGVSEGMIFWLGRIWKLPQDALCFFEDDVPPKHRLAVNAANALLRKFPNNPKRLVKVARIMSERHVILKTALRLVKQEAARRETHAEQASGGAAPAVDPASAVVEARPSADPLQEILQALELSHKALRHIADFPLRTVEDALSLDGGQATAVDRLQAVTREVQSLLGLVQKNSRPKEAHLG